MLKKKNVLLRISKNRSYGDWAFKLNESRNINIFNDDTYDYYGFYEENPNRAYKILKDKKFQFPDKYQTSTHPIFSDRSIYNTDEITGGSWDEQNNYHLSEDQYNNDWDTDRTIEYLNKPVYAPNGDIILHSVSVEGYKPIELQTYYPLTKEYFIGHSLARVPVSSKIFGTKGYTNLYLNKKPKDKDYNLVTNNCSDLTLDCLNYMFLTSEKPFMFTTPGNVQDFAIEKLGGHKVKNKDGSTTVYIPRTKENYLKLSKRAVEFFEKFGNNNGAYFHIPK